MFKQKVDSKIHLSSKSGQDGWVAGVVELLKGVDCNIMNNQPVSLVYIKGNYFINTIYGILLALW